MQSECEKQKEIFRGQLSFPHNTIMDPNNVMKAHVPYIAF